MMTSVSLTLEQASMVMSTHHSFLTNGLVQLLARYSGSTGSVKDPDTRFGSGLRGEATEQVTNSQTRSATSAARMTMNRLDGAHRCSGDGSGGAQGSIEAYGS